MNVYPVILPIEMIQKESRRTEDRIERVERAEGRG